MSLRLNLKYFHSKFKKKIFITINATQVSGTAWAQKKHWDRWKKETTSYSNVKGGVSFNVCQRWFLHKWRKKDRWYSTISDNISLLSIYWRGLKVPVIPNLCITKVSPPNPKSVRYWRSLELHLSSASQKTENPSFQIQKWLLFKYIRLLISEFYVSPSLGTGFWRNNFVFFFIKHS